MAQRKRPPDDNKSIFSQTSTFKNGNIRGFNDPGVRQLTVPYSGSGDQGSEDGIQIEPQ